MPQGGSVPSLGPREREEHFFLSSRARDFSSPSLSATQVTVALKCDLKEATNR